MRQSSAAGISAQPGSKESSATSHAPQLEIDVGTALNFSGRLSGDVSGSQTNTTVTRINNSPLGLLLDEPLKGGDCFRAPPCSLCRLTAPGISVSANPHR